MNAVKSVQVFQICQSLILSIGSRPHIQVMALGLLGRLDDTAVTVLDRISRLQRAVNRFSRVIDATIPAGLQWEAFKEDCVRRLDALRLRLRREQELQSGPVIW
jgi:hypothetical protein